MNTSSTAFDYHSRLGAAAAGLLAVTTYAASVACAAWAHRRGAGALSLQELSDRQLRDIGFMPDQVAHRRDRPLRRF